MRVKDLFILPAILLLLASCSTIRKTTAPAAASSNPGKNNSIRFIDDISINSSSKSVKVMETRSGPGYRNEQFMNSGDIERFSAIRFKFAILENASVEELTDTRLLEFMNNWYGVNYHFGGTNKDGIDCSAFAALLMDSVYGIAPLPRMSRDQYVQSRHISKYDLAEGDLVFFHTYGRHKEVTHVGIYLRNNKFVHASTSGVMISDMGSGYYADHFVGAGRMRN